MLHFVKSKEENAQEYYFVLFGEFQKFFIKENLKDKDKDYINLFKLLTIYSLYSLYYTQTYEYYYRINTIPEILEIINNFIIELKNLQYLQDKIQLDYNRLLIIVKEITLMMSKMYSDEAFSIGTLIGLKTIILNKYSLPIEQKTNVYKDFMHINQCQKTLENLKITEKIKNENFKNNIDEYLLNKREIINNIKNLKIDSHLYCEFMNQSSNNHKDKSDIYSNQILLLSPSDFDTNKQTVLDLKFNYYDNIIN
jgi:hypothetical protein